MVDINSTEELFDPKHCGDRKLHPAILGFVFKSQLRSICISENVIDELEQTLAGSLAEFTFLPHMSTIGDVDKMFQTNSIIASFDDIDDEMVENYKHCFYPKTFFVKIRPYRHYPGYVNLIWLGCFIFERKFNG